MKNRIGTAKTRKKKPPQSKLRILKLTRSTAAEHCTTAGPNERPAILLRTERLGVSSWSRHELRSASHETEHERDHQQNDRYPEDDFRALYCGAHDAAETE